MGIPDLSKIKIERGSISEGGEDYRRYRLDDPISPRAPLGSESIMWYTGDEHDEYGHITEDPETRIEMYNKRMAKLVLADKEIPIDKRAILYGHDDGDFLLIGWGFVKGVALSAIDRLVRAGYRGAYLHLKMFSPFPSEYVKRVMGRFDIDRIVSIEHNYSAQSAKIIALNTGLVIRKSIVKYTGRPMYTNEVVDGIKRILGGQDRVVLKYGA
jgi:2-oxoglutarate ferredoxin oxidoreductase subunit alpha